MRIIFVGMKGAGKTTLGQLFAKKMQVSFVDSDAYIKKIHNQERGELLLPDEIIKKYGAKYFSTLETKALKLIAKEFGSLDFVFACGGRTPLPMENQEILSNLGTIVFLEVEKGVLLQRILALGIPTFFPYQDDPERSLDELLAERVPVYRRLAHITIDASNGTSEEAVVTILTKLRDRAKN